MLERFGDHVAKDRNGPSPDLETREGLFEHVSFRAEELWFLEFVFELAKSGLDVLANYQPFCAEGEQSRVYE